VSVIGHAILQPTGYAGLEAESSFTLVCDRLDPVPDPECIDSDSFRNQRQGQRQ